MLDHFHPFDPLRITEAEVRAAFHGDRRAEQGEDVDGSLEQIRLVTGVPGLDVEILMTDTTVATMRVADRFSSGRVHLVGDAAHTMPPQGGMGGNTALMDGFYLAWKIAAVLRGEAGPGLLDSHDAERRPVGELIAENQYRNAIVRNRPDLAREGDAPPIEDPAVLLFGYRHNGALVREPGDEGELLEDATLPTGRPGSRAPHVRLSTPDGELSTIDLFGRSFVLLTGSSAWARAADEVAATLEVRLKPQLIGGEVTAPGPGRTGSTRTGPCCSARTASSRGAARDPAPPPTWRKPSARSSTAESRGWVLQFRMKLRTNTVSSGPGSTPVP
ncbi:FAD-dependent monooxygenase [Saccharopolyspora hattusasensis]|uniref:FAD-dependent monooxygenase n=1 Tax=Saccharopolyspora hattusasensis TaxID=1128679 RepID=UPI003D95A017